MAEPVKNRRIGAILKSGSVYLISILVLAAHFLVFFFVEIKNLRNDSILAPFMSTVILASMVLIMGILTVMPGFTLYVGRTLTAASVIIILSKIAHLAAVRYDAAVFDMSIVIELLIGFASFLYGRELIRRSREVQAG
ncbi:hypothetical protein HYX09_01280 [Candidatus Woesearchaeota archaeon]|nr:hypothetical protein [Candidatus Woesearchaeota archaeon]